jgi:HEAT repeat protein
MSSVTPKDLAPWIDPDELLQLLGRVEKSDRAVLHDAVVKLLEHEDEDVREEALRVAAIRWTLADVRDKSLEMLESDDEPAVRRTAAYAIAALATESTRQEDTGRLLEILRNSSEQEEVRRAAYEGLLLLHGRKEFPPMNREIPANKLLQDPWLQEL